MSDVHDRGLSFPPTSPLPTPKDTHLKEQPCSHSQASSRAHSIPLHSYLKGGYDLHLANKKTAFELLHDFPDTRRGEPRCFFFPANGHHRAG